MPDIVKKCEKTGREFIVNEWEQKFLNTMGFPLPTLHPEERLRRRLSHRNERRIYKDICDLTGKPIISLYSPDKPFKVYSQEAWWSDKWDARDYGRDFDFNRPFFEQFHELQMAVPRFSLMNTKAENSEYCNVTTSNKNCYLVFGGDFNEDCMYSVFCFYSKDCSDTYWANRVQLCYDLVDCDDCYNLKYSQNCHNCRDSAFLYECRGCNNCFGCVGLVNKEFYIFNKKYSKEDYKLKIKEFGVGYFSNVQKIKKEFAEFKLKFPHRYAQIINCENCSGDNIIGAKNCINCFDVFEKAEDLKDVVIAGWGIKDALSCNHVGHGAEICYEVLGSIALFNCAFCTFGWNCNDVFYCDMVVNNCKNLFGCSNMKKAQYCILNKQYTKKEYEELMPRIVEHMKNTPSSGGSSKEWGQFFPMKYSPWAYNETVANDYFPSMQAEIEAEGLRWMDEEKHEIGSGQKIPDCIDDTGDDILEKSLVCEKTRRPYKINEKELKLYRKLGVPIPHYAPETRNMLRFAMRNPRKVWERKCAKCGMDISTSFSPDRPDIVYCEKCYLEAVY